MDVRRLRLFLAVVDAGGFTAAAREVHVAQPAVSLAVRDLEEELGTSLLVRSRTGVTLTAAGQALVGPARQTLRDLDNARAAVDAVTGLVSGHLEIACLPTLAADPVAGLVGSFRRAHPRVGVRLAAPADVAELAAQVRSGAVELGITDTSRANHDLVAHPLTEHVVLAVSAPARPRPAGPLRLADLGGLPLVLTPAGSGVRDVVDLALADAGIDPDVAVETAQRDALIPLVLAGAGTAFLPETLARAAERLGAVVRETTPRLRREVVVVQRRDDLGPAATRFLALARGTP